MIGSSNILLAQNEDLSILINDKKIMDYNGTEAKTLNIKLSDLGASAINHTHEYLPLSGGVMSAGSSVKSIDNRGNSICVSSTIAMAGFTLGSYDGVIDGIIKITLPVWYTDTMMLFEIAVWNYAVNTSTVLHISGYNYSSDNTWYNPTVVLDNSKLVSNVRFGDDGTHCCILINSVTGIWNYPVITITKALTAYHNAELFRTGVTISIVPDDSGFNNTLRKDTPLIIQKPNY